jgi:hypothetical protein
MTVHRETRCKEDQALLTGQPERSAVAKHITDTAHGMKFSNIHRLAREKGYMDSVVKEVIEIHLHPNNFKQRQWINAQ